MKAILTVPTPEQIEQVARERNVGVALGNAIDELRQASKMLEFVWAALVIGGHYDAALIVSKQRQDMLAAAQRMVGAIQELGISAIMGFGERRRC